MKDSNDTGKVIGALLVGALAGAALGILFAPNKGSKTRSKLIGGAKGIADDLRKKIKNEANALRSKAEELEGLAEDKIHDLAINVSKKTDGQKHHN